MPRFCGNCGSKLDRYSGLCPNCSNRGNSANSYVYREKMKIKNNSGFKIFITIIILFLICIVLNYYGIINLPFIKSNEYNEYNESSELRNAAVVDDINKYDSPDQKGDEDGKEKINEIASNDLEKEIEESKDEESEEAELRELLNQKTKKEILAFYYEDFDSDGTKEAYAIVGNGDSSEEQGASLNGVDVFFIKSNKIVLVKENIKSGKTKDIIDFGKYKLVCFEMNGGNSTSLSYIFGARNGKPQEMNLSGKYGEFEQDEMTGVVTGYTNEFNNAHKRQYYEFEFDEDNFKIVEERKRVLR